MNKYFINTMMKTWIKKRDGNTSMKSNGMQRKFFHIRKLLDFSCLWFSLKYMETCVFRQNAIRLEIYLPKKIISDLG